MFRQPKAVVIDTGSYSCKAGLAGTEDPIVVPTQIGRLFGDIQNVMFFQKREDYFLHDNMIHKKGLLNITCPMECGEVINWDDMNLIFDFIFSQLKIDITYHPIILTDLPFNSKKHREKMMECMFEKFNAPACHITYSGLMALYGNGKTTGLIMDIGDTVSYTLPIYEGFGIKEAIQRINLGGRKCTERLRNLLTKYGYYFTTSSEMEILRDMKEKCAYIALDFPQEIENFNQSKNYNTITYTLPDGQKIELGNARIRCGEILFNPMMIEIESMGIDRLIFTSIMKCPLDTRKDLYENINLIGGGSLFKGMKERLEKEISQLAPPSIKPKIEASKNGNLDAFLGASALADSTFFNKLWISKDEYEEYGTNVKNLFPV